MILKNRQAPQMPPAHFARSPTVRSHWRDDPCGGRVDQPSSVEGLQLADTVASAAIAAFEPDHFGNVEQRYLRELALHLYRRGYGPDQLTPYGLKIHPGTAKTAYPWLRPCQRRPAEANLVGADASTSRQLPAKSTCQGQLTKSYWTPGGATYASPDLLIRGARGPRSSTTATPGAHPRDTSAVLLASQVRIPASRRCRPHHLYHRRVGRGSEGVNAAATTAVRDSISSHILFVSSSNGH
jgi:hypothetical protein